MQGFPLRCRGRSAGPPRGSGGRRILKERTMVNSRRRVQLFGFPVELPGEQEVPGFHVWPPEEEVPGFRMNSDGSVRLPTERKSSVTDYAWPSVMAELTQPPLQPKVGPP